MLRRALCTLIVMALGAPALAASPGVYSGTRTTDTDGTESWITLYNGHATFSWDGVPDGATVALEQLFPSGEVAEIANSASPTPLIGYEITLGGCVNVRVTLINDDTLTSIEWMIVPEYYKAPSSQHSDCSGLKANYSP